MTQIFDSWTEYDNWLMQNYNDFSVSDLNEVDGKVSVSYMTKEEWAAFQKNQETKSSGA